ncbi:hypothetical protein PQR05_37510, partial [Paraburkholderia sediminicola]|uniref:hypothetical protein n=1 Tax=Paraburkholderia sediminicola TaxID=458836 RepID=UPI0038BAD28A
VLSAARVAALEERFFHQIVYGLHLLFLSIHVGVGRHTDSPEDEQSGQHVVDKVHVRVGVEKHDE